MFYRSIVNEHLKNGTDHELAHAFVFKIHAYVDDDSHSPAKQHVFTFAILRASAHDYDLAKPLFLILDPPSYANDANEMNKQKRRRCIL